MQPLLERNRHFAAAEKHEGVSVMPRQNLFVLTCLDPRVDPAAFLGMELGDGMVSRNVGGRVTGEVLRDIAFISTLAGMLIPDGPLFEVAVVHHTGCGAGFLADPGFRSDFGQRIGAPVDELEALAVVEPEETVRTDVQLLRSARALSSRICVSGHVYDVDTGLVRMVVPPENVAPES